MHFNTETALDFVEGRLAQKEELFWQKHVEICDQCTETIGLWLRVKSDLRRSHLNSVSPYVLGQVIDLFPCHQQESRLTLRSVIATLIFDSFQQPAFVGARGTSARQLVMHAEDFDVHIMLWGDAAERQMLGQLLPRNGQVPPPIARFHLIQNGKKVRTTAVDELGEFHFTDIPEGDWSLEVDLIA
jgi:hypothetical protein